MNKPMKNMPWILIVFSLLLLSACGKKVGDSDAERAPLSSEATRSPAVVQSTLDPIVSPDHDVASSAPAATSMENDSPIKDSPAKEKSEKTAYPPTGTNQAAVGTNSAHQEELALATKSGCMV